MIRAIGAAAALLATAAAAVALPTAPPDRSPALVLARASAPLAHSNSRDGRAILTVTDMRPGERRSGEVTIRNEGGAGAIALLSRARGPLADRLRLTVSDSRGGATPVDTALAAVPSCTPLGELPAEGSRTYRFTVAFERGTDDNAYAGAAAQADFEWLDRCVPGPSTPLAVGDTRLAIERGPYRFSGRAGTARVGIRCRESATGKCVGRLELERRRGGQGRGIAMAVGRFRLQAGGRGDVVLRLNRRARRRIRSTGLVAVRAYVTAIDAQGRAHRVAYRDRLLYGKRR